jgi:hypothetical protein
LEKGPEWFILLKTNLNGQYVEVPDDDVTLVLFLQKSSFFPMVVSADGVNGDDRSLYE